MTTKPDSHSALNGVKVSGPAGASTPHPDLTAADPMEINAMANSHITPPAGDRQHVPTDQAAPELHRLKIDAQPMSDLLSGNKTCEVRNDDRGFSVGDCVHLVCADGRETDRIISHIQRGYGLPDGLCVLSYRADLAAPSAPAEVAGLVDRLRGPVARAARDLIAAYFKTGERKCLASIPARPDHDADLLLAAGIADAATALTALQAENERLRGITGQLADALHTADTIISDYTDIASEEEQQEIDAALAAHAKLKGEV